MCEALASELTDRASDSPDGQWPHLSGRRFASPSARARLAYVTLFAAVGAATPYLPVYYQSLGLDFNMIGLLAASVAAVGLVAAPVWGAIADRFAGSRYVLPIAAAAAAAASLGLALVRDVPSVVVMALLLAASVAGIVPLLDARALDAVGSARNRYGGLRAWGSASFIATAWLVGWLVDRNDIRVLFAVYVPALLATALVTPALGAVSGRERLARFAGIGMVIRVPMLMRLFGVLLGAWASVMCINAFLSIRLVELGAPAAVVGVTWAVGALVEIPLMWAYPALARRFGTERLLVTGAVLFALRAIVVVVTSEPLLVVLSMVLAGGGFAFLLVGGVTYVSHHAPQAASATAQGILAGTVFGLSAIVGPGLGGLAAGIWGLQAAFQVAAIGSLSAVVAMAIVVGAATTGRGEAVEHE